MAQFDFCKLRHDHGKIVVDMRLECLYLHAKIVRNVGHHLIVCARFHVAYCM